MRSFTSLMAITAWFLTAAATSCGGTAIVDPGDDGGGGSASGTSSGTSTGTGSGTASGTSSGTGTGAGTSSGTPGGTGTGTSAGTPAGTAAGTPAGTATGNPANCFQQPDFNSCVDCLAMLNPQGIEDYTFALFDNCVCGPDCQMACQPECNDPNPDPFVNTLSPPCDNCVQNVAQDQNGPCVQGFQNQCGASPACVQFVTDLQDCPF